MSELAKAFDAFRDRPVQPRSWWQTRVSAENASLLRQDLLNLLERLVKRVDAQEQHLAAVGDSFRNESTRQAVATTAHLAQIEAVTEAHTERLHAVVAGMQAMRQTGDERSKVLGSLCSELTVRSEVFRGQISQLFKATSEDIPGSIVTLKALAEAQLQDLKQQHLTGLSQLSESHKSLGQLVALHDEVVRLQLPNAIDTAAQRTSEEAKALRGLIAEFAQRSAEGLIQVDATIRSLREKTDDHEQVIRNKIPQAMQSSWREIEGRIALLSHGHDEQLSRLTTNLAAAEVRLEKIGTEAIAALSAAEEIRRNAQAELAGALERMVALSEAGGEGPVNPNDDLDFQRFYMSLERKYRGSRELIVARLQQYTPRLLSWAEEFKNVNLQRSILDLRYVDGSLPIAAASLRINNPGDLAAVDLGCGRGEWLELLVQLGWVNLLGIDSNPQMIEQCREARGLPATTGDAIGFLHGLPDQSIALLTGFHVIEHLPFDVLRRLATDAFRVLQPGGLCIFETPNPENLLTASQYFFLDPTHQRVLPPDLASLVLEHAGFRDIEIVRMQPNSDLGFVSDSLPLKHKDATVQLLLNHFRACRDYAVIGRRP